MNTETIAIFDAENREQSENQFPGDLSPIPESPIAVPPSLLTSSKEDQERQVRELKIAEGRKIKAGTVCVAITFKSIRFVRKVSPGEVIDGKTESIRTEASEQEKPDLDMLHVSKDLIQTKEIKNLTRIETGFKKWLRIRSVDCGGLLRGGIYLIPLSLVKEVDEMVRKASQDTAIEVARFLERYDEIKLAAKERLGKLYNEDEYPDIEKFRNAWRVTHRYLTLNVPAALEKVNSEIYAREQAKAEQEWAEASTEIRNSLRAGFAEILETMATQLGTDENGKRRRISQSRVEELKAFLETFEARNLTNDSELSEMANKAKSLMQGIDVTRMRKEETLRDSLGQSFREINESIKSMVVNAGSREMSLNSDL